jgi:hypothetical protein
MLVSESPFTAVYDAVWLAGAVVVEEAAAVVAGAVIGEVGATLGFGLEICAGAAAGDEKSGAAIGVCARRTAGEPKATAMMIARRIGDDNFRLIMRWSRMVQVE